MFNLNKTFLIDSILAKVPDVKLIYLFGSFASGEQHPKSDLDVAILPAKALDNLSRWQLAQTLACELNIDVDLIDLNTASTVLCQQVITQGVLLWGSQNDDNYFTVKTMSMYQHLQVERSMILADLTSNKANDSSSNGATDE
ncbi:nucleotidyltransferase domain-containing protein [Shewanella sp. Isolate13]|uniref:type VII toxin-antitoxin system MntA family adenylyltransferase antitoxin n=1 Tax=Shewanella sp. Isolate13 TaxID=2908531 RepID=UPI001EFCC805|nr:nucleotidyltransferase domain-containing protein [Shewanella sp. Isolate13]MCG9730978.1 nucleotidyltransferase domain-containing protein [Shewanella sp. Isolate13]